METLDEQAQAKILQIGTAEEADSISPELVADTMTLLRRIGKENGESIAAATSEMATKAANLENRADSLDMQMAKSLGSKLIDETTDSDEEWIMSLVDVSAGDLLVFQWECSTTGNQLSIERGNSSMEYVETLYTLNPSTTTKGTVRIVASTAMASLRIFSQASGLSVVVYKVAPNVIGNLRTEMAETAAATEESISDIQENIDDINDQLYQSEVILEETTSSAESWIMSRVSVSSGDVLIFNWSCPTVGGWFSIERGDSELARIETLYTLNPTTSTRGSVRIVADSAIESLRVFSTASGFTMKVSKGDPSSVINGMKAELGVVTPAISVKTTGLYAISTGAIDSSTDWYGNNCKTSVIPGQVVSFRQGPLATGYGLAWMGNGSCIGGEWYDLSAAETITVTVPDGADEMRLSWNRNWVPSQVISIDNSLSTVRRRLAAAENSIASLDVQRPHAGGKILSLGDSYTMMNYYGQWLAQMTGCTQTPRGYNGQNIRHFADNTYQDTDDWAEDITQELTSAILEEYDIITVIGGTNDYGQGYPAGSITDDKDDDTVAAHVKWLLNKLYTLKPDARIYFCTQPYRVPHPAFHDGLGAHIPNAGGSTLEECMDAVVAVCRYYGVPCLDFYHESGWNEWTNRVTNPEAGDPSSSNIYPPFEDNPLSIDGLHPRSGAGHGAQRLGYMFGMFINSH